MATSLTADRANYSAINRYYDHTYFDYWLVWTPRSVSACHFGFYDDGVRRHSEALLRTNARVADLAAISAGSLVVDAGSGLGGTSLWLAAERGANVLGLSLNLKQVISATRSSRRLKSEGGAAFAVGDYLQMPIRDHWVDAVIAIESLCHAADKPAFFAEAARVLKPGGRLVVADYMKSEGEFTASQQRVMSDWLKGWAIPGLPTHREYLNFAERAGFSAVRLSDVTANVERSLRRLYRATFLGLPVHRLIQATTGLRSDEQGANIVASRRQYQALKQGLWSYGHLCAVR